jgi:aminoglycoside phosphotransferase (APT) family kinase protein
MTSTSVAITAGLVAELIRLQFPRWKDLSVAPVPQSGCDNRTFRLGQDMVVRLPSSAAYASQVEREHRWLPVLAVSLPLLVPEPLAMGGPALGYPWCWSIYRWLPGEPALPEAIGDPERFARDVASFLRALESAPGEGGPAPGADTFHRGGRLANYHAQAQEAFALLAPKLDVRRASEVWDRAMASQWSSSPVWVHGDMSVGNLLIRNGVLCGVIDFGQTCIGDPACDLVLAWTLLRDRSRAAFRESLQLDDDTWARGRGWALWKAAIVEAGLAGTGAWERSRSWNTIVEVLADHDRSVH